MSDYIIRAMAADRQVRLFAAATKDLTEEARRAHNTTPVATAALGRLLTAGAMMGTTLKGPDDRLTLQIIGDGPIGSITVTADADARVKGYVRNPGADLPLNAKGKLDVGGAVGAGSLRVIKDMGLKDPYVGQVELVSGEIAEDLTYYFSASEQTPSSVALGVLVSGDGSVMQAGGFILQLMPYVEDSVIDRLEQNLAQLPAVTSMLAEGLTPEQILERVTDGMDLEITSRIPAQFYCSCSKDRVKKVLASTGRKEILDMIADGQTIEVNCHFCGKKYYFTVDELALIADEL